MEMFSERAAHMRNYDRAVRDPIFVHQSPDHRAIEETVSISSGEFNPSNSHHAMLKPGLQGPVF